MRVLLLTSYCDEEGCTDDLPCLECLKMCNTADLIGNMDLIDIKVDGGWDYLTLNREAGNGE